MLFFFIGLDALMLRSRGEDYPGLAAILRMLSMSVPLALAAIAYLVVHRAFDRSIGKKASHRIATSPAHFLWCVLEPVVFCTLLLAHFPGYNRGIVLPLDAIVAFGASIAPWLLFLTALGLIRKHPVQAIIGLLTALAVPVAALAFH